MKKREKYVIFGAGRVGKLVTKLYQISKLHVEIVMDNDSKKWGHHLGRIRIESPEKIGDYLDCSFVVASAKWADVICEQLINAGVLRSRITVFQNEKQLEKMIYEKRYSHWLSESKYEIFNEPQVGSSLFFFRTILDRVGNFFIKSALVFRGPMPRECKFEVSICAIFKNEASYLQEWILFHMIVGVEHFYLYNNNSSDNYLEVLNPFVKNGTVTLIDWPLDQMQMQAYKDCISKFSLETKWLGFIDLDEFVVPKSTDTIYEFLKDYERTCGSVLINWKVFGTSGLMKRESSQFVVEDFTVCWPKYSEVGKCFYNTAFEFDYEKSEGELLHHHCWTKNGKISIPPMNACNKFSIGNRNRIDSNNLPIQINHYFTKSYMEYVEKEAKGDVYFQINPHDEKYFYYHEMKCGDVDVSAYKYLMKLKRAFISVKGNVNDQ